MQEELRRINYKSDFKDLVYHSASLDGCKFRFVYFIGRSRFIAEYDGTNYTNCERIDSTQILVTLNNHGLPQGRLGVVRYYWLPDDSYPDGSEKVVSRELTNVVLTDGKTDGDTTPIASDILLEALRGYRGYSAYEIAVQRGFEGSEDEWLASFNYVLTNEDKREIAGIVTADNDIAQYDEGTTEYNDY